MDLEALLLGAEPIFALGVGLGVLALGSAVTALGNTEAGQSLVESGRDLTKHGIKWGIETFDKVQTNIAEAGESWNDLVAEAQSEIKTTKESNNGVSPKEVEISE